MHASKYRALSGAIYTGGRAYQFHLGELSDGTKPDDHTLYEIGSITKTYTGLLLSQAVYDHKVDLDVDVRTYLKGSFPKLTLKHGPVTLKHLVTHSSGLPMNINCNEPGMQMKEQISCLEALTREQFFTRLAASDLVDDSGKEFHYSNAGVQLVGYVLEDVYSAPFSSLLEKYVFSRSGERETLLEAGGSLHARVAGGENENGERVPVTSGYYEYAGRLKSCTDSMLKYIQMYLKSDDPAVKQAMHLLAGDSRFGRAFAWNTFDYDTSMKMLYHNGGTFGQSSWVALYPDKKLGIFLVTNRSTPRTQGELNELSNKIVEQIVQRRSN